MTRTPLQVRATLIGVLGLVEAAPGDGGDPEKQLTCLIIRSETR